jgi:hypothetical protein
MTYETALWLAHELLLMAAGAWALYLIADGFIRDRKEAGR